MNKNLTSSIALIGYASGVAAGDPGCGDGPLVLQEADFSRKLSQKGINTHWQAMLLPPSPQATKLASVTDLCTRLAHEVQQPTANQQPFIVFGGDHSCAIGTWSGVAMGRQGKPFGLIWIDAHMDSHTHDTSESGNIHGMPVACLLGHGKTELTHIGQPIPKILPQNIALIGIRSYESGEEALLEQLGVRIFRMPEVKEKGITAVMQEAIKIAQQGTDGFGISIDLDGIDPDDAPGVGTPVAEGIGGQELCRALRLVHHHPALIGLEIAEFNPHQDHNYNTLNLINHLIEAIYGR